MKAIILAGGKGERLRPLTNTIPKPMVPVMGKPILEHTINLLKKYGVTDFIIAVCYLSEKITEYFEDGKKFGVNITYLFEDPNSPLGTAGAISGARNNISETFIVTCADVLREIDINKIINAHKQSGDIATMQAQNIKHDVKSILEINDHNKLTGFKELGGMVSVDGGPVWSNASVYIFEPEIFNYIPEKQKSDFAIDIFPKLLSENITVNIYPYSGYVLDIGTPENLKKAEEDIRKPELGLLN